jgi:hypothetical protein
MGKEMKAKCDKRERADTKHKAKNWSKLVKLIPNFCRIFSTGVYKSLESVLYCMLERTEERGRREERKKE